MFKEIHNPIFSQLFLILKFSYLKKKSFKRIYNPIFS